MADIDQPLSLRGPIRAVKSNDLTDQQIQDLWIPFDGVEGDRRLSFYDPCNRMATMVLGGKGSGKTHMLRFYSFPVQGLRYQRGDVDWTEEIARDGFVGIYTKAGGLNGSRFFGKGEGLEVWKIVFAYYLELWLGIEFLEVVTSMLSKVEDLRFHERDLVNGFLSCFDNPPELAEFSIAGLLANLKEVRKDIDRRVNDLVFGGPLRFRVRCSPGRAVFGFPQVVSAYCPSFRSIQFSYSIDEYENFLPYQQESVNTLLRERESPVTFRIGARTYGVKSRRTNSADEDIRAGSEYEELMLDQQLRENETKFGQFAREMVVQRTSGFGGPRTVAELDQCFSINAASTDESQASRHLDKLEGELSAILGRARPQSLLGLLRTLPSAILQKAAIYHLYQDVAKGNVDLVRAIGRVEALVRDFPAGSDDPLRRIAGHYGGDFEAQLRRDGGTRTEERSLGDFLVMSEGLPRVFLTIMKNIFAWAEFEGHREGNGKTEQISPEARRRGLEEASRWFFRDVPQSGKEGELLVAAIDRLATLFRVNRFADKPIESSLIQFSVPLNRISQEARDRINNAESRCLLIRREFGEKDRSASNEIRAKYQLNRVICPIYELPIARRGTARLDGHIIEAVFGDADEDEFSRVRSKMRRRLNWPFLGAKKDPELALNQGSGDGREPS